MHHIKQYTGNASYETFYAYAKKHIFNQPAIVSHSDESLKDPCIVKEFQTTCEQFRSKLSRLHESPTEENTPMDAVRLLIGSEIGSSLEHDFTTGGTTGMDRHFGNALVTGFYLPRYIERFLLSSDDQTWEWIGEKQEECPIQELLLMEKAMDNCQLMQGMHFIQDELNSEGKYSSNRIIEASSVIKIDNEEYVRCQIFHPFFPLSALIRNRFRINFPEKCLMYIEVALLPVAVNVVLTLSCDPHKLWLLMKDDTIPEPEEDSAGYFFVDDRDNPQIFALMAQKFYHAETTHYSECNPVNTKLFDQAFILKETINY